MWDWDDERDMRRDMEWEGTTMTLDTAEYTALRPIKPYVGPQWFVEIDGSEVTGADVDEWLDGCEVEVLDTNVIGWGYQVIIRATADDGATYDYLANYREDA